MNKGKDNIKIAVIAGILLFGLYFLIQSGSTVFEVTRVADGDSHVDKLDLPVSANWAQSLFNNQNKSYDVPMLIQSSIPLSSDEGVVSFKTVLQNPLKEKVIVQQVLIYQNGEPDSRQLINIEIQPEMNNVFNTQLIDLQIVEGQSNTILLEFLLESESGNAFTETFEYNYYALNSCRSTDNCDAGKVCDLENIARFSKGVDFYCVDICGTNTDCAEGQLCIKGRCGY